MSGFRYIVNSFAKCVGEFLFGANEVHCNFVSIKIIKYKVSGSCQVFDIQTFFAAQSFKKFLDCGLCRKFGFVFLFAF